MKLTKRLQVIADMVDSADTIYDVGCDHAYLDIYLAQNGFNCTAIDVRENVVDIAKKNVCLANLENKINVVLNNGLNNINITDHDIVVLSGLGAKTILNIVNDRNIKKLVVQSNDNLYLLRKTMMKRNYYISDEKIVLDDNKFYVVIKFEYGYKLYNQQQLLLGPLLLENKTDIYYKYLSIKKEHFENILQSIPKSNLEKREEIEFIIENIKMALN